MAEYIPDSKPEFNRRLIMSLHGQHEPEALSEEIVDWDGGAREPAPLPSDPQAEHDQLLVDWLRGR